jgi:hypothetical protein
MSKLFKTDLIQLSLRLMTILLIFLTVVSCQTLPKDFPKIPDVVLKQTLYQQNICSGASCARVDKCQYWEYKNDQWIKTGEGPIKNSDLLKSCHGSFGISAKEFTLFQEWVRQVKRWGEINCGVTNN